jgi:glycosyltransferase involved in cell wall biosynthesis
MSRPDSNPHVFVDARFNARQCGGDRCRIELATHLHRQHAAKYTFLTYDETDPILRAKVPDAATITTDARPNQHPRGDWFEHVRLPKMVRASGADIYHGTFHLMPLLRPAWSTLVTIHDMAVWAHPEAYGRKFAMYGRFLVTSAIKKSTRVLAVSEATKSEIERYLPGMSKKVTVILNGVGAEFVAAGDSPKEKADAVCKRLGIPMPFVLFVGNLEMKKNLPRLIEAFQRLRAAGNIKHSLVVVGQPLPKGPAAGIREDQIGPGSGVHFPGYVTNADLPMVYRAADLVAYPSIYEGFGMPVLEGMAAGTPVLTSSVSSLPEVAGGAALLVDPFDPDAIAAGIRRGVSDSDWRAKAVAAGRDRALELSWERNARQTSDVYQEMWEQMQPVAMRSPTRAVELSRS